MEILDLTHPWGLHTPGWVGYAGGKIYYTQNLQTNRIVSQAIETSLHSGTHLDGPMHAADGGQDLASLPLTKLLHRGAVIDVSDVCGDWDIIKPEHITSKVKVQEGDVLIIHTGYHRYYQGQPEQDLVRYFCMHPGGGVALAEWMLDMKISWWGIDAGSGDHPMNTTIRTMRPDLAKRFQEKTGKTPLEFFGEYEYQHHRSGRKVKEDLFPMHYLAFAEGCIHAENVGGDIDLALNQRCVIGAFPWKFEGGEACPCRILCFFGAGTEEIIERASHSQIECPATSAGRSSSE